MIQRKKMLFAGIGVIAVAGMLVSFTGKDDEKNKRYQIIHQENGVVVEYDTVIPMSSNYTVEQFLSDKGIENENVEIVKIPSFSAENMHMSCEGLDGANVFIKHMENDIEMDGEGQRVQIIAEMDDEGNMTTKKIVNGEEVEMTEEELEKLKMHHDDHGMMKMIIHEDGNGKMMEHHKDVQMTVEIDDDGTMKAKKIVNGEEVELTDEELEQIKMRHNDHDMIIDIQSDGDGKMIENREEVKIMVEKDDEGNMVTKKFVNGKEVEMTEEDMEHIQLMEKGGNHIMIKMDSDEMGDVEIEKIMKALKIEMSELEGDSENIEIKIEKILEEIQETEGKDGERVMVIKHIEGGDHEGMHEEQEMIMVGEDAEFVWESEEGDRKMKVISSDSEEDFTIVLVTEDCDNAATCSKTNVRKGMKQNDVSIYPNPNDGAFTINFNQGEKVKTSIEITDLQGKVVFEEKLGKFKGEYRKEIDLKKEGAGTYFIKVQRGDEVTNNKVIID